MPYRLDIPGATDTVLDRLVDLGALDVESSGAGIAALMPDHVAPADVARLLDGRAVTTSVATARDNGSVWLLAPRVARAGRLVVAPPGVPADPDAIRIEDAGAFGTGHHPTTRLCLEALEDEIRAAPPARLLDVGTGSGILAIAALRLGVPRVVGVDLDDEALAAAARNARLNGVADRLRLVRGGPEALAGAWPLLVANILAAPLIALAPALARRLARRGTLILSGIADALESEVRVACERSGLQVVRTAAQGGWIALVARASW